MNDLPPIGSVTAFIAVAETGAFNEAARRLGLSPSATSKSVTRLEEQLGVKLFHRTTRSVGLTPEGERYLDGARRLVADFTALGNDISSTVADPSGRLTVSAPAALGRMWLVDALNGFLARWPQIDVDLRLEDRLVDLAGDAVDIAIRSGPIADSTNLVARHLFDEPHMVCATPDYWERHGRPAHPRDLAHHRCLNFRNQRTGRPMQWTFSVDGAEDAFLFDGPLMTDDGQAVGEATVAGLGVGRLPRFMAATALKAGDLEEVLQPYRPPVVPYWALYLDRRLVSPRIRAFMDHMRDWRPDFVST